MINYLYGELNEYAETAEYQGVETPTIAVEVDNRKGTISANLKALTVEGIGLPIPPNDGYKYLLACVYECPSSGSCCCVNKDNDKFLCPYKVPVLRWEKYVIGPVASNTTISGTEDVANPTYNRTPGCGSVTCG